MNNVLLILLNLLVLAMLFFILSYLWLDRQRFRIERQYTAVRKRFAQWAELAAALPGCGETAAAFAKTRNLSKKLLLLAELADAARGAETEAMHELAAELDGFCDVYNLLAEPFNKRLDGRFWGPVAKLLGFRPFPPLRLL